MDEKAVGVRIFGRVQGVSFRYYAYQEGLRLGVKGWVRNRMDGTVEGMFQGSADQVDAMVRWCSKGSPMAEVSRVEEKAIAVNKELEGFNVRL